MKPHQRSIAERVQLDLFRSIPGDFAPRDAQDLMAYPFFSLSKSHRTTPIDFEAGKVAIRVEAVPDHGMATIWDADILIWAASQIVQARDAGLGTSRLMAATPYEILRFIGRGTSLRDYQRLKAALDRLQSTTVSTTLRQKTAGRRHRFSWINEWKERTDNCGRPDGIDLILPDWFYQAVLDNALVLTIDRAYFDLTGGLERWLYRIVRKHGGRQSRGWRFELRHLHYKSGSLSPFKRFAFDLREIVQRQPLPGYRLILEYEARGRSLLAFEPCGKAVKGVVRSGTRTGVPSGTPATCHREPNPVLTTGTRTGNRPLNLESNTESNVDGRMRDVENLIRNAARSLSVSAKKSGSGAPTDLSRPAAALRAGTSSSTDPAQPGLLLGPPGGRR